jgi:hypothetical protein
MNAPMTLRIEVGLADSSVLDELHRLAPDAVMLVNAKRFDGPPSLVQAIILLSPLLVSKVFSAIVGIITKQIESKQYVSVEYNNIKIAGMTADNAERILANILNHERNTKTP